MTNSSAGLALVGLLFVAAIWLLIAPTWVGYALTTSDWITSAVLATASLGLGFWSFAVPRLIGVKSNSAESKKSG